jgi:hypothetical protein
MACLSCMLYCSRNTSENFHRVLTNGFASSRVVSLKCLSDFVFFRTGWDRWKSVVTTEFVVFVLTHVEYSPPSSSHILQVTDLVLVYLSQNALRDSTFTPQLRANSTTSGVVCVPEAANRFLWPFCGFVMVSVPVNNVTKPSPVWLMK